MDWLLRKCRRIRQILCSYGAFVVLALTFACVSFLYVFRAWFNVTKATVREIFPRWDENVRPSTSREKTSPNVEAQNPSHTMNWERMHQNLESYADLTALSSTVSYFGSLFTIGNAFSSIGTTAWNIAFQKVENSSPSTSTNKNSPDLRCPAVRVGEFFAARKMILTDNVGESVSSKRHPRKMLHNQSSQQSSNRPSSQKRKEDELDIEPLPGQSPVISRGDHQEKSTQERSKKIRSSKLKNIEPVRSNPRRSNRIKVGDSKRRKSGDELHQESPGSSSQLSRRARVNSFPPSYKINEGAGPSTQSGLAPWEENVDKRQREESSQESKNERIRMQDSPLGCARTRVYPNPSRIRPKESTEENMPGSYSRFSGADVVRQPIKQEFQLHNTGHKCVFSNTHVRSKPSEKFPNDPHNNSLRAQASPSKFIGTPTDCSWTKLSPKRSRPENISIQGTSQFSETDVDHKPLEKSTEESPDKRAVHSSHSVHTKAYVGSSPTCKSLLISPLKSPRTPIASSTSKILPDGYQEENISMPHKSLQFSGTVVLHPIKQSPEECPYGSAILQHSPEDISRIYVPSIPYKQLPEGSSHESPRKPGSPSTLPTARVGRSPIKRPLDEDLRKECSPFKSPRTHIRSSPSKTKLEDFPEKRNIISLSPFRSSGADVGLHTVKQSTEEFQHERKLLQHSPVAISGNQVPSSQYKQLPSQKKRSLDENLKIQYPPSKSPRTSTDSSPSYKSPDKSLKVRDSTFNYLGTLIDFSPNKSPPKASREEKIGIPLSPFRLSGTDVKQQSIEYSSEESQHKRVMLQHSPVAISQSHVSSSPHKELSEGPREESPSKMGSPYAFSKAQISSKPIKQENIPYRDSPYVFPKTILHSNPNEISIEGSCFEKPISLGTLYAISESRVHINPHESLSIQGSPCTSLTASTDSCSEILSEESPSDRENNSILDQSSQFSRADIDQYPIKQFAEESQHGNSLLQDSSITISAIYGDSNSSEESPEISQHERFVIQIPSSSYRGTYIHEGSSEESTKIFISENRDFRSSGISEVNIDINTSNQLTEKSEDRPHSVSKPSPKENIKSSEKVFESPKIRVKEGERTTRGKEGVDTKSPAKSPIEINGRLKTERNTEDMLPRFHAATASSDEISEECDENSPSNFRMKCTISSGESMEEYVQKMRKESLRLEEPNPQK